MNNVFWTGSLTVWNIAIALALFGASVWFSLRLLKRNAFRPALTISELLRLLAILMVVVMILRVERVELINVTKEPEVAVLYDISGSMETKDVVGASAELVTLWQRPLSSPAPAYRDTRLQFDAGHEPIVLGKRLFVGSNRDDSVTAFNTDSGEPLGKFFTDGPIRFAPGGAQEIEMCFVFEKSHDPNLDRHRGNLAAAEDEVDDCAGSYDRREHGGQNADHQCDRETLDRSGAKREQYDSRN